MNKKGFTLTEIIGAIIILGILVIIAVITFTGSMKGFREDYYTDTVRTLTESGKEFFNDNRKYRPSEVLNGQIVPLSTLVSQHYIDDIKDYNGNSCSSSSYVIVIKNGKDDYVYHTCLVCPEDDFSNMNDNYCDAAWTNSTSIEYSIARPPELYKYKGTPKEKLKEELGIKVSYVKKNSKGEVIGIVDGTGFDDVPVIYPDDVDGVDTNTLGTYELTYRYQEQEVKGHVTIYEYKSPDVTITKEIIRATNLTGGKEKITGTYEPGEWTQKIHVTMTKGEVDAGGVNIDNANLSNIVHKYQWNKDGIWQDFCNGDDCTNREVTDEFNQEIKFRSVDINGIVSEETTPITIRIDNTKPTCSIKSDGTMGNENWYVSNVDISFTRYDDLVGTSIESVSGIKVKNITIETGSFNRTTDVLNQTHTTDTHGVKYIGFVEDQAYNSIICDVSFKRDATDPVCTSTSNPASWTNGSVTVTGACNDNGGSGCVSNISQTYSGQQDTTKSPGTIYDVAGNSKVCPTSAVRIDTTNPTCTSASSPAGWTNGDVTVTGTCADTGGSGCKENISQTYSTQQNTTHSPGTVYDNAGNSVTCPNSAVKIDKTAPTCTSASSPAGWTNGSVTVTGTCADTGGSGCVRDVSQTYNTQQNTTHSPGTVYDVAGNSVTCPNSAVKIDKTAPTCTSASSPAGWTNGSVTVTGTCADTGGSGCVGNVSQTYNTQQDTTPSPGTVYDNAGNSFACPASAVKIDKTAPSCGTTTYSADSTAGVHVSISCIDTGGSGCWSAAISPTKVSGSVTLSDDAGNSVTCSYTITSYSQYHTRTWNTCKTGNDCVGGNVWDNCKSKECVGGYTEYNTSCTQGCPNGGTLYGNGGSNSNGTTCYCKKWEDCQSEQCVGGYVWDNCKSRTPCVGGWNSWGGWSNGTCTSSNTSTWECETRTMYHGGN